MRRIYIRKRALYTWQKGIGPIPQKPCKNETHIHGQKSLKRMTNRDWYKLHYSTLYLGSPWYQIRTATYEKVQCAFEWDPYTWPKEPYINDQRSPISYTWDAHGDRYALQPTRQRNGPSSETHIHDQKSPILTTKRALYPIPGKPLATDTHCNRRDKIFAFEWDPYRWGKSPIAMTNGSPP